MARSRTLTKRRIVLLGSLVAGVVVGLVVALTGRDGVVAATAGVAVAALALAFDSWRTAGRTAASVRRLRASGIAAADRVAAVEATATDVTSRLTAVEDRTIELGDAVELGAPVRPLP